MEEVLRILKPNGTFLFSFFSRKHDYISYCDFLASDIARFNTNHPNKRLAGATLLSPSSKEDLKKYFDDFSDVKIFTVESDQTPIFESWWYVSGKK